MVETQGIINNLDYISALGATTWVRPLRRQR
jgi:hypothetical protein